MMDWYQYKSVKGNVDCNAQPSADPESSRNVVFINNVGFLDKNLLHGSLSLRNVSGCPLDLFVSSFHCESDFEKCRNDKELPKSVTFAEFQNAGATATSPYGIGFSKGSITSSTIAPFTWKVNIQQLVVT
jgi:hypothetical protein